MTDDDGSDQMFLMGGLRPYGANTLFTLHIGCNWKIFLTTCFLFYLDNIPEIYFDNFFEVAYEIEKNI